MILGLLLFVFLFGCAENESYRDTMDCDVVVDGMCVDTNGFPIDIEMLSWEIYTVEFWVNQYVPESILDIVGLITTSELITGYVEPEEIQEINPNAFGVYSPDINAILIRHLETDDPILACNDYYIFAHELLHFVADEYLHSDLVHEVPRLFVSDTDNEYAYAELWIWTDTAHHCNGEDIYKDGLQ